METKKKELSDKRKAIIDSIAQEIRVLLDNGTIAMRTITLKVGVSYLTIARLLNNEYRTSPKTIQKLKEFLAFIKKQQEEF